MTRTKMKKFLLLLLFGYFVGTIRTDSDSDSSSPHVTVTLSSGNKSSTFSCPEQFGYFDDVNDCSKYYVCVFGEALQETCTGGLYFSAELQTCDWPRNIKCNKGNKTTSDEFMPPGQSSVNPKMKSSLPPSSSSPSSFSSSLTTQMPIIFPLNPDSSSSSSSTADDEEDKEFIYDYKKLDKDGHPLGDSNPLPVNKTEDESLLDLQRSRSSHVRSPFEEVILESDDPTNKDKNTIDRRIGPSLPHFQNQRLQQASHFRRSVQPAVKPAAPQVSGIIAFTGFDGPPASPPVSFRSSRNQQQPPTSASGDGSHSRDSDVFFDDDRDFIEVRSRPSAATSTTTSGNAFTSAPFMRPQSSPRLPTSGLVEMPPPRLRPQNPALHASSDNGFGHPAPRPSTSPEVRSAHNRRPPYSGFEERSTARSQPPVSYIIDHDRRDRSFVDINGGTARRRQPRPPKRPQQQVTRPPLTTTVEDDDDPPPSDNPSPARVTSYINLNRPDVISSTRGIRLPTTPAIPPRDDFRLVVASRPDYPPRRQRLPDIQPPSKPDEVEEPPPKPATRQQQPTRIRVTPVVRTTTPTYPTEHLDRHIPARHNEQPSRTDDSPTDNGPPPPPANIWSAYDRNRATSIRPSSVAVTTRPPPSTVTLLSPPSLPPTRGYPSRPQRPPPPPPHPTSLLNHDQPLSDSEVGGDNTASERDGHRDEDNYSTESPTTIRRPDENGDHRSPFHTISNNHPRPSSRQPQHVTLAPVVVVHRDGPLSHGHPPLEEGRPPPVSRVNSNNNRHRIIRPSSQVDSIPTSDDGHDNHDTNNNDANNKPHDDPDFNNGNNNNNDANIQSSPKSASFNIDDAFRTLNGGLDHGVPLGLSDFEDDKRDVSPTKPSVDVDSRAPVAQPPPPPPTRKRTRSGQRRKKNRKSNQNTQTRRPLPESYTRLPSRPPAIYETPRPLETASKCDASVCVLPDCNCGHTSIPGGLRVNQVPQIVLLTFDDAVNDLNWEIYQEIFFSGRKNPNGCPLLGTFYVSHEWTDYGQVQTLYSHGHEMASHGVTHSFGEKFSKNQWMKEINGQREILHLYGGVKLEDVRGMRAPFLQVGGNRMFEMLYEANFTYDSSMPVFDNRPPFYPYTLDYTINHECMITPCPTKSYPGLWEVGMVMWEDLNGNRCSMGDACSNPSDEEGVYKMLLKNFNRHYKSNRAPFGLFYHSAWFNTIHHKKGFIKFLDEILSKDDVYLTTNWQMIQWMRDPTPLDRIDNFGPWRCDLPDPDKPKPCLNPTVCNVKHSEGSRFMKTCQPCPFSYPWVGNTGFDKSS